MRISEKDNRLNIDTVWMPERFLYDVLIDERVLVFVERVFLSVNSDELNFLSSNNINPIVRLSIKIIEKLNANA